MNSQNIERVREAHKVAQRVETISVADARALPGILGIVAGARLAHQGWYAFTNWPTGEKVLLVTAQMAAFIKPHEVLDELAPFVAGD